MNECIPTVATKCSEGYYLIKGGAYVKESTVGDGVLWHCSGTGDDDDECVDKSTGSSAPLGYLTNAELPVDLSTHSSSSSPVPLQCHKTPSPTVDSLT